MFPLFGRKPRPTPVVIPADTDLGIMRTPAGVTEVNRVTWTLLLAQSDLDADDRNNQLVDVLIDIRRALDMPMPVRSPLIRPAVPVIPGRDGETRPS
jgi:hypothetical protein